MTGSSLRTQWNHPQVCALDIAAARADNPIFNVTYRAVSKGGHGCYNRRTHWGELGLDNCAVNAVL